MTLVLRTRRLVLRDWTDDDLEPFAEMNADPAVMEHFPALLTRAESDAVAERLRALSAERGFGFWAVAIPGEVSFAGFIGLSVPSFVPPFRCSSPCIEIGWRLAKRAWGKGYATEGARAVLAHGFEKLGLDEIVSFTAVANTRSRRVMEKIAMTRIPEEDFDHPRVPEGHPLRRHVLYRVRPTR